MIIFDQNVTKNEALTKPHQFMNNSQISSFGTSTGPHKGDRKWRTPEMKYIQRRAPEQTVFWKCALKCQELYLLS